MGKFNQGEAIRQALLARGEKKVEDRTLSKFEKYTRTYLVERDAMGLLVPTERHPTTGKYKNPYYFIARYSPSVRIGEVSTRSTQLSRDRIKVLIEEGRRLAVGRVPDTL